MLLLHRTQEKAVTVNEAEIYTAIRSEIVTNHVLMHLFALVTAVILIAGTFIVEKRETVLAVFLPLFTLAWAAATVRFDYFIHRQGAFLRAFEGQIGQTASIPLWESWKYSNRATNLVVPLMDVIVILAILVPTLYMLFGPCQKYFDSAGLKGGRAYAWVLSVMIVSLLLSLGLLPFAF